ncbi:hypothetical protein Tco_1228794 [Tanacetum coccineum]
MIMSSCYFEGGGANKGILGNVVRKFRMVGIEGNGGKETLGILGIVGLVGNLGSVGICGCGSVRIMGICGCRSVRIYSCDNVGIVGICGYGTVGFSCNKSSEA